MEDRKCKECNQQMSTFKIGWYCSNEDCKNFDVNIIKRWDE